MDKITVEIRINYQNTARLVKYSNALKELKAEKTEE